MAQINELPESENNISPGKNTNMSLNSKMQESNAANSAQKSDAVSTSGVERSNSRPFSSLKDSSVKNTVRNPKAALKQAAATKVADMVILFLLKVKKQSKKQLRKLEVSKILSKKQ